jgi:uncharacterized protein YodC (DUF2158 family)
MPEDSTVKVGDVVSYNSGGHLMTVISIDENSVTCVWSVKGDAKSKSYPAEALKKADGSCPSINVRFVTRDDDRLRAALLRMVLEHCSEEKGILESVALHANTDAIRLLAEAGLVRIDDEANGGVRATVLPEADAFLVRMEQGSPGQ